jgi:hypothetical protein
VEYAFAEKIRQATERTSWFVGILRAACVALSGCLPWP